MPIERTEPTLRLSSAKPNIAKRLLSALLLALMLVSLVTPVLAGTGTEAYVNLDDVNVRTGAGTQHATVKFSGSGIMLNKGHYVRIIATQKDTAGMDWYQIVFTYRGYTKVGFMRSDFVSVLGDDAEYAAYLDEQGFPKSYQPYLRALHAASGGKWNFVANQTGLDWGRAPSAAPSSTAATPPCAPPLPAPMTAPPACGGSMNQAGTPLTRRPWPTISTPAPI